jgi:hypothetical protein
MDISIENNILYEQLLQEAFLDSVKAYAQEKYNRVVDKISDWKDAAAVIGQVISNPTILQRFSDDVWRNFKTGTLKRLIALLNKIGLGDLVTQINNIVTKITDLNGWQKFLAATGIGAIVEYVVDKMASLAPDAIRKFISSYLSEDGLKSIISKLTDFQSYLGWLQPIIKGVDMLYAVLKHSIEYVKTSPKTFTQNVNLIRKEGINENMDLKEFIKQLVRDVLDEESTTAGVPGYSTPYAFSKKGQKTNGATEEAGREGMKKVPKGMPSDSKVYDYKSFFGKKPKYKMYKESDYDKASPSSNPSQYLQASGYTAGGIKGDDYYKKESMKIQEIIKEELLNEATYKQFKKEVKFRTKAEQLHKAMREVKRKLSEIDRIVEYTTRMKQELSEGDGVQYWNRTEKAVHSIAEMVNHLNNKINNLKQ